MNSKVIPLNATAVAGQFIYMEIPASTLRGAVDSAFPYFAKCAEADSVTGFFHRWIWGHDLLIHVPETFASQGVTEGLRHAGHVVLTDFPTKAGIPIPGFSHSGLGQILAQYGIQKGWLNISVFDTCIGVLAIAQGHTHLQQAFAGVLKMNARTFIETFGAGTVQVSFAVVTQNPLLLVGGIENLLAGLVSTIKTFSVYVDPVDFFGATLGSAVVGALFGYAMSDGQSLREKSRDAMLDAYRSALVSGAFKITAAFGYGALLGLAAVDIGKKMVQIQNERQQAQYSCDPAAFERLLQTFLEGGTQFASLLEIARPRLLYDDSNTLLLNGLWESSMVYNEVQKMDDTERPTIEGKTTSLLDATYHSKLNSTVKLKIDDTERTIVEKKAASVLDETFHSKLDGNVKTSLAH